MTILGKIFSIYKKIKINKYIYFINERGSKFTIRCELKYVLGGLIDEGCVFLLITNTKKLN